MTFLFKVDKNISFFLFIIYMSTARQPRGGSGRENKFFQKDELNTLELLVVSRPLPDLMQQPIVLKVRRFLERNSDTFNLDVDYSAWNYPTVLAQSLEQGRFGSEFSKEEEEKLRGILRSFQQRLTFLLDSGIDLSTDEPEKVLYSFGLQTLQFSPERQLEMIRFAVKRFRRDKDRSGELIQLPYMINLSPEAEMTLFDVLQENPSGSRLLDSETWGQLAKRLASVAKDAKVQRALMMQVMEEDHPWQDSVWDCLQENRHLDSGVSNYIYQARNPL